MKNIILYLVIIAVVVAMGIAVWRLKREINSWLFYDRATEQVVCEMVKPEYLKQGVCSN